MEEKEKNWESFLGLCLEQPTGYIVLILNEMPKTEGKTGLGRKPKVLVGYVSTEAYRDVKYTVRYFLFLKWGTGNEYRYNLKDADSSESFGIHKPTQRERIDRKGK